MNMSVGNFLTIKNTYREFMTENYKIRENYMLAAILFLSLILRIIGFNWGGDGMLFYPDEPGVVEPIIYMTENLSYVHGTWMYPSMSSSKLIAFVLILITRFIKIDWINYYYITRVFYAFFSTIIVLLSYLLVKKIEDVRAAALFAFLLAINPIHVRYAKITAGDTPVMVFWLLTAFIMQRYISDKRVRYLALMSFFAACSTLEKWNGAGIAFYIAAGIIYFNWRNIRKLIVHAGLAFIFFVVSVLLLAPNMITDIDNVLAAIMDANPWLGRDLIEGQFKFFFSYVGIGSLILMLIGLYRLLLSWNNGTDNISKRFPYLLVIITLFEDWLLCHEQVERHGFFIQWGCMLLMIIGFRYLIESGKAWKKIGLLIMSLAVCSWILGTMTVCSVAVKTRQCDTRVVGAKILQDLGATIHNTIADNYTPYIPPYGVNTIDDAYLYDNMIDDTIYSDAEGNPCITIPGKKYAVSGKYTWPDWTRGGYAVLEAKGDLVREINSDIDVDLAMNFGGQGGWNYSEFDTIRRTYNVLSQVWNARTIGASLRVYDISSFSYKPK